MKVLWEGRRRISTLLLSGNSHSFSQMMRFSTSSTTSIADQFKLFRASYQLVPEIRVRQPPAPPQPNKRGNPLLPRPNRHHHQNPRLAGAKYPTPNRLHHHNSQLRGVNSPTAANRRYYRNPPARPPKNPTAANRRYYQNPRARPPKNPTVPRPNGPPNHVDPPVNPRKWKSGPHKYLSDEAFLEKFKLNLNERPQLEISADDTNTKKEEINELPDDKAASPPPEDADEIFKKMKETGLIPNAVSMLDALCKDGLLQEAMKLFALMREKGTIPEVVIYTAVVEGFCKAHKLDDAKRIFAKMQHNGITPNAFTYTVLIQGLYKCNHLDDALGFCVQMLQAGFSPNVATFVGLVDAFCSEKGVDDARSAIKTLLQNGFFVNEKAIREFLDKNGVHSLVRPAVFGEQKHRLPFELSAAKRS